MMKFSMRAIPAAAAIMAALVLGTQVYAQTPTQTPVPSPASGDLQSITPGAIPANPQKGDSAKPMRQPGMTNKSNTPKATKDEETASPGSVRQRNAGKQPMRQQGMGNKSDGTKPRSDQETANPGAGSGR